MGQKTTLDKNQKRFLGLVIKEPYLLKNYYWTGGTVLSEFYLKHRESLDIDLFTEKKEIHLPSINKFVSVTGTKMGSREVVHRRFLGLHTYIFKFPNKSILLRLNLTGI